MKKLLASISISTTLAISVFAVPVLAFESATSTGGSGAYSTNNYNTDTLKGTTVPQTIDPYGSYYHSSNTGGQNETQSVSPRMRSYGIESTTPNTYTNYGTKSFDSMHANLYKTKAVTATTTNKFNWGWLGLLGLIGLAGLRGRDRDRETS
ncbi:hypothetical protein Back11_22800 [Paenibacillus baekrokdamisoli]|uniref:Uncharacterized protein n=1 Tax=Paenibacillus baekrokdamisoli TaxID=1712516 RepID=A0A3G9IXQ6_9BACL|nr:WGxxGxxG family protein [Paenibacillus baekrokdamisoli]MBB3069712.1 hypothetical protein [Paenibacillus baekrokdamisoli]BBH20935.1 hypothetical protein Back11_22800 [Paenibacillus baekrokdamisoli]